MRMLVLLVFVGLFLGWQMFSGASPARPAVTCSPPANHLLGPVPRVGAADQTTVMTNLSEAITVQNTESRRSRGKGVCFQR